MMLVTAMSMCSVCHFKRDAVHRRLAAYTNYIHKHQPEPVAAMSAFLQPLVNLQFHLNKQYSSLNDVCSSVCMQNFQCILISSCYMCIFTHTGNKTSTTQKYTQLWHQHRTLNCVVSTKNTQTAGTVDTSHMN